MRPQRPEPRPVRDWKAAEQLAADWMRYLGFLDAAVTPDGADGGIDVRARDALAQVKFKASQVGGPELQRLFGARGTATEKQLLFFTGTSYSSKATEYAAETGIALFIYDWVGDVEPANATARRMLRAAVEPASAGNQESNPAPPTPTPAAPWQAHYATRRPTAGPQPTYPPPFRPRGFWQGLSDSTGGAITTMNLQVGMGAVGAAIFGGAFTMFGVADVVHQYENWGAAAAVGILGFAIYVAAVFLIRYLAADIGRRSRNWATGSVLGAGAAAGALFIAVAAQPETEHPSGLETYVVAGALIVPFVALLISTRRAIPAKQ